MKPILCILTALLLAAPLSLHAEDLPELAEWWSMEASGYFGQYFSFLPDFDTAQGGAHAVAVYGGLVISPNYSLTWYLRHHGDTVNQFNWPAGAERQITQVDLNKDGATDYLTWTGLVYPGIQDKHPPQPTNAAQYYLSIVYPPEQRVVRDVNNDGYEDVICPQSSIGGNNLFTLLLGGSDLTNLKVVSVKKRPDHSYGEYFLGAFSKQPGDTTLKIVNVSFEIVTVNGVSRIKWYAIVLRELKVTTIGDTVDVAFNTLDSLWFKGYDSVKPYWSMTPYSSLIFANNKAGQEYLLFRQVYIQPTQENKWYAVFYEVKDNKLHEIERFSPVDHKSSSTEILGGDINGDGYNDWAVIGWDNYVYFYRGLREGVDSLPFARYRLDADRFSRAEGFTMLGIGDVTGDGIGDMAVGYDVADGRFSIVQGRMLQPVGVPEPVTGDIPRTFDMQQNYPNPVGMDRKTTIPITVEKAQHLTLELWTLSGKKIAMLYQGWMPSGRYEIDISLSHYRLASGLYIVRLTGVDGTRERAILLD